MASHQQGKLPCFPAFPPAHPGSPGQAPQTVLIDVLWNQPSLLQTPATEAATFPTAGSQGL